MSETEYTDEYIMQAIKHFRSSQHPHEQRSKSSLKIVKGATSKPSDHPTTSTPTQSSKKSSFSVAPPNHALVLWSKENKYSIVLCADIQLENGDNHVQEGVKHMVKFGKGAYEATVILTCSRELCQIVEKL